MRSKLKKFTEFANSLLPHETAFLLDTQQFVDDKKLKILHRVDHNCRNIDQFTPYDETIDKRKYSNLKKWITQRLEAIDVDAFFEWIMEMERKILTDSIQINEEKQLLKTIRNYEHPIAYFTKFYELVRSYDNFLLIRLRYQDHIITENFLNQYKERYQHALEVNEKMHQATQDIVRQYSGNEAESKQWEAWLNEIFLDETMDPLNRYMALIRLSFIAFNYNKFDLLMEKFDDVDKKFARGFFYSKRILLNYYNNRLLLHSRFNQYDEAIYYGYLSVREKNHDYIFYINNLCAVLLRQDRDEEALKLMRSAAPEMKTSKNFHNKVGFVSFYIKALNSNGLHKNAENYAESFFKAYEKEVLRFRWHLFFTVYLETMLHQEHYMKLLQIARKYKLLEKDKLYHVRANYSPVIPWLISVANYRSELITKKELITSIKSSLNTLTEAQKNSLTLKHLKEDFKQFFPGISEV
ncbi:MAG: hypothetical protein DWQ02_15320 [Bacteroidetes bacterium]|nr:MAG: hypothetical protein DWQ02_15320 [Bacteroidota bacterium]